MKIAIVDLSSKPSPMLDGLDGFGLTIKNWLSQTMAADDLTVFDVADAGQPVPAVTDYDGFVIGGSEKGVYDQTPWMEPVRQLLHATRSLEKPVFGICFGHQIMAESYGGKAEHVDYGDVVGVREFVVNGKTQNAFVWHHDQVTAVPPQAHVTGHASYCPIAALSYDFPAMSVQFHPEYTDSYLAGILSRGRGEFLDDATTDETLKNIQTFTVNPMIMAKEVAAFFGKHIA